MNKWLCFLICFFIPANIVSANLQDYFKPAQHKSDIHKMRNIDFIYMINLDQRPEKYAKSLEQLTPYGIYPYRFSAVNGWELTLGDINELGVKLAKGMETGKMGTSYLPDGGGQPFHDTVHVQGRCYFCHCMSRGAIGIVLSHLSILQDAYDSGYNTIWVMEDDIQVIKDPNLISSLIERLDAHVGKKKWDILFTDQDTKNQKGEYVPCLGFAWRPNFKPTDPAKFTIRKNISSEFKLIGARYGAYSMIIRRSGMKKILNFIKTYAIFLPYDMDFYLPNNIRMYAVNDDIVSTITNALSDNGNANYQKN